MNSITDSIYIYNHWYNLCHQLGNHQSINSIHRLAHLTALLWTGSKRAIEKNATCWNVSWAGATSPCPLNPSFSSLTSQSSVANSSKDQTESQQHQPIKNHIIIFWVLRKLLLILYKNKSVSGGKLLKIKYFALLVWSSSPTESTSSGSDPNLAQLGINNSNPNECYALRCPCGQIWPLHNSVTSGVISFVIFFWKCSTTYKVSFHNWNIISSLNSDNSREQLPLLEIKMFSLEKKFSWIIFTAHILGKEISFGLWTFFYSKLRESP